MDTRSCTATLVTKLLTSLAHSLATFTATVAMLTIPPPSAAQHHHYNLIVLGTLGGPQSYAVPCQGAVG
jgi:hypothetical protein